MGHVDRALRIRRFELVAINEVLRWHAHLFRAPRQRLAERLHFQFFHEIQHVVPPVLPGSVCPK
jgi:hypothetical protein